MCTKVPDEGGGQSMSETAERSDIVVREGAKRTQWSLETCRCREAARRGDE